MGIGISLRVYVRSFVLAVSLAAVYSFSTLGAERVTDDWLRGSGKDLEIRLTGEVLDADGTAATEIDVTGALNNVASNQPLKPMIEGDRFTVWIPVNQSGWYSMWLRASSKRGDHVAYANLNAFQLRQAAIDGLKLKLQAPTRHVEVKVFDKGQPVSGAMVKADVGFGVELRSSTDAGGIARFALAPKQRISSLTAWTKDYRIGGFGFDRKPTRDPDSDEQTIELSRCRDQKMRFVDEQGAPVPGIDFVLQIATAPPNYNFVGTNEHFYLKTDGSGEATFKWFPDWEEPHYCADLKSEGWVLVGDHSIVDNAAVFKLKKAKDRKRIEGRVVSTDTTAGGFFVTLSSFQGERENYSDPTRAFTNPDGTFAVDVLPDATYCAYVLDARWVGDITDLIPYNSKSDQITSPELSVSKGQEVGVIATSGPLNRPYTNLGISFRREHRYTWQENGRTRTGVGGPQWWTTTDENGHATTQTLPGKLEASVYTPLWRTEQTVSVREGEPTTIRLHRENEEKRNITGRLVLAEGLTADLKDAEIQIGSVDGQYEDEQTLTCGGDGLFAFETIAEQVGVLARTKDGRAAGSIVVKDPDTPIRVQLRPTLEFEGQLLGEGNQPVIGRPVFAYVRVEGKKDRNSGDTGSFESKRIRATTDEQGNFTLRGVPSEMAVNIFANASDDSNKDEYFERVYLNPNESRPRTTLRLAKTVEGTRRVPLANRYKTAVRDCAATGYRLLRIMAGGGTSVTAFVDQNFAGDEANKDLYSFMNVVISDSRDGLDAAAAAFLKEQKWELPGEGQIVAYALDDKGKELGRLEIAVADPEAPKAAAEFIRRHAPAKVDAEERWHAAFAEAERTNRRVWARVSQRHCGPCFMLARWLDDQHELLSKDYVMLKIDDYHDENGEVVAKRVTRGGRFGIPFYAIFDANGEMLIDSAGPLGNIGYPGSVEGKNHLRKMLQKTRQNLTDEEINTLIESLAD